MLINILLIVYTYTLTPITIEITQQVFGVLPGIDFFLL